MVSANHIKLTAPNGAEVVSTHLSALAPDEIITHMSDPRVAEHMPLLTFKWDQNSVEKFIATKEEYWHRDGLGHWAFLCNGTYAGWGGFQKERDEWDFGLVLKPEYFGLGMSLTREAIHFAKKDERIAFITFLLPPSRKNLGALKRLGASFVEEVAYEGTLFRKYVLELSKGMIGYVTVGTNNFENALNFYDELFASLGVSRLWKTDSMAAWGISREEPALCIARPFDGEAATVGNGVMIALKVKSKKEVEQLHSRAIELGAKNEGDPGPRGSGGFYGGYFRDLDGNKLNAYIPGTRA